MSRHLSAQPRGGAAKTRTLPDSNLSKARAGAASRPGRRPGTAHGVSASRRSEQIRLCVGLDVVDVAEVAASLERFQDRYVSRLFTADEAAYCRAGLGSASAARFAARFAAKEATVKALQPEGPWADWRAIEVRRRKSGSCVLVLHREAAALARRRGIQRLALSMSHDGDRAAAIVVGQRAGGGAGRER
jgi:holo-[acyl-carrier protein] synthase